MANSVEKENVYDDGTYVVKKSRKHNILAFIICLLVAFVVWVYAANKEREEIKNKDTEGVQSVETADTSAQAS